MHQTQPLPLVLMAVMCNLCCANGTRAALTMGRNCAQPGTTNALVCCFVPWPLQSLLSPRRALIVQILPPRPAVPCSVTPSRGVTADVRDCAGVGAVVVEAGVEMVHDAQVHNTEG